MSCSHIQLLLVKTGYTTDIMIRAYHGAVTRSSRALGFSAFPLVLLGD
jgi:hypothetical protein